VLAFVFLAFGMIYYFAPNLHEQKFRWVLPGMVVGVALWLAVSLGFRLYLRYFNTYNAVYGSLGAVIILMFWFYLTGAAILIGGEVNSEIERAAAAAGAKDAKLPGEKSPGEAGDGARADLRPPAP
jgi:membrane protein